MTNDTPLEAAVTGASGAGRNLDPASVAPNTTAASTAARASMPRGVRLNVWGLSHQTRGRRGCRRTSAMTRASSAESQWTGRFSSAATRVTSSSSCSSTLHVGLRQRRLVGHHHPLAPGSLAANGAAAVDQDLEHPGAEPLRRGAPFQGPVRPDARFPHGVLGVGLVAQAVQGIAAQAVAVAGDQTSAAPAAPP